HDGVIEGTQSPARSVPVNNQAVQEAIRQQRNGAASTAGAALQAVFRPDQSVWDGRFANNGWLQELPRPFTKLTWDNAVLIGPATATDLGGAAGDVVELDYRSRTLRVPAFVLPGQAEGTVTLHLGQG